VHQAKERLSPAHHGDRPCLTRQPAHKSFADRNSLYQEITDKIIGDLEQGRVLGSLSMCGRASLSSDASEIKIAFGIPPERPAPNFAASWNVAPTDPLPIVRYDAKEHQRSLEVMRWGLIPYWAKEIKIGFSTINARAEEIDNKPAFREAFRQRRCLVPLDNLLRMEKDHARQAALCDRAQGRRAHDHGRVVGDLALEGWRADPQLHDRDDDAERALHRAAQPHACGAQE
jgi:hypothetical protein